MRLHNFLLPIVPIFFYMSTWYLIALWKRRNDLADVAWGPGFLVATLATMQATKTHIEDLGLIIGVVALWAIRLSTYIGLRNSGKSEDFRYRKWREEWGKTIYWRSFLQVFMLQGFFIWLVGLPIWTSITSSSEPPHEHIKTLGIGLWVFGFLFEAIADAQISRFKSHKKTPDQVMDGGLWRYSRHPNYFGEAVLWWGVFFICISQHAPWWSVIGPITITYLLVQVSGVPMLEKKYRDNSNYIQYQARTSAFIPWFPKKK